jgi:putative tricarboxylic transport membrane protein
MRFNNAISGGVLLILALAVLWTVKDYPKIPGQNIGPGAFPGLVAVLLLVCALVLIWRGVRDKLAHERWVTPGAWLTSWPHLRNFLVTIGCLLFYILASDKVGFILTSILILSVMFWVLNVRQRLILPVAVFATLVVQLVFYKGLRVPLPWGWLMPFAW